MSNAYDIIFYNGNYLPSDTLHLSLQDRAFRYGDGLFETMHANGKEVQFFQDHMLRFRKGLDLLKLSLAAKYTDDYLNQCIDGLLHRTRLYQGASVKLSVWRNAKGKFIPDSSSVNILIEATYLSEGEYALNKEGLVVDVFSEHRKPIHPLFSIKSCNSLIYILAGVYAAENAFDDVLLLNDAGHIVEATSSNVFFVKDDMIYTPSLDAGCLHGVMRKNILSIARKLNIVVQEIKKINQTDLLNADEVFLTNANVGIKWVVGYRKKRYLNRVSKKLIVELNNSAFNSSLD